MAVYCEFKDTQWGYTCKVSSQEITENVELKFIGSHKIQKCDNDVIEVWFDNCNITKVPQGLAKKFPNLEGIFIKNSNFKNLSKNDLAEYKFLKWFHFDNNQIDFLPGDLFEGFKNLQLISFSGNKLTVVEPNILDGLDKLKRVNFDRGERYGYFKLNSEVPQPGRSFKEIKTKLCQEFCKHDSQIVASFIYKQQTSLQGMKNLVENLTEEKQELQQRFQNLKSSSNEVVNENRDLRAVELELTKINEELTIEVQELTQKNQNLTHEVEAEKAKNAANNSKFTADIKNFIQAENFKDFKIKIDDREFHVHKFLLAARSPTLAEILQNNPEAENLNLVDISVEIFEKILKFLYTDELPREDGTNFLHLFAAAGRLKIEELKNFAAQKILNEINGKNALEILNLSNKYGHDEMRQKAFDEIKKNYRRYKFEDDWISDGHKIREIIGYFKKIEEIEKDLKRAMKKINRK